MGRNLECKECSTLLATEGIDDKARCKKASRDADRDLYLQSDSQCVGSMNRCGEGKRTMRRPIERPLE